MKFSTLRTLTALSLLSVAGYASEDPKQGGLTYYGSASAERAPEYAELHFTFQVQCLGSANEVRKNIEAVTLPIWKEIDTAVTGFSETDRQYWGDVSQITASPSSTLVSTAPSTDNKGNLVPGSIKRVDKCNGKEVPLNTPVGQVFSGTQNFGVRSSNLDWIEALHRTVSALPQATKVSEVRTDATEVRYFVTDATARQMRAEVKRLAREQATGPGSLFENDRKALGFASAHLLSSRNASAPHQPFIVGAPVERGTSPKVSMTLPFVYTIYAEGTDLIDQTNRRGTAGITAEYQAQGTGMAEADFAQTQITVQASCQTDRSLAAAAIKVVAARVGADLKLVQGTRPLSETDRLVEAMPSVQSYSPYKASRWQETGSEPKKVLEYIDECTGKTVLAPSNGRLPEYFVATQEFTLKSSDFTAILNAVEAIRATYGVSTTDPAAVKVTAYDAFGDVLPSTKAKLLISARQAANACVFDPKGSLADDSVAQRFQCAHLKSIRIENDFGGQRGLESAPGGRAMVQESAVQLDSASKDLEVIVIKRDGETRPRVVKEGSFAFDFQFVTNDYVPNLKAAPTPVVLP
jgi:hypothetical protein